MTTALAGDISTKTPFRDALLIIVAACILPTATSSQCRSDVYNAHEVLRYAVRWSFIRIGTVEVRQQCTDPDGQAYDLSMFVRSADNIPFINLRFENRSVHVPHRHGLIHETIITGDDTSEYRFDQTHGAFLTEDRESGSVVRRDTVRSDQPMFDALGLFMLARCFSGASFDTTLKTLLEHTSYETDLHSSGEVEHLDVDAFPGEQTAVVVKGNARWVGNSYGGMSGEITGWISNDARAIPLKAKVGIFLGSIVLELESYTRGCDTALTSVNADNLSVMHNVEGRKP